MKMKQWIALALILLLSCLGSAALAATDANAIPANEAKALADAGMVWEDVTADTDGAMQKVAMAMLKDFAAASVQGVTLKDMDMQTCELVFAYKGGKIWLHVPSTRQEQSYKLSWTFGEETLAVKSEGTAMVPNTVLFDYMNMMNGTKAKKLDNTPFDEVFTAMAKDVKGIFPGDVITFGNYPVDEEGTTYKPIEWMVLDVQDNRALILTRQAVDAGAWMAKKDSTTWETSELRTWLNKKFLKKAFTEGEIKSIFTTTVINDDTQYSLVWKDLAEHVKDMKHGKDTRDKVFLLSWEEVERLIVNPEDRLCTATPYALNRGVMLTETPSEDGTYYICGWMTRTLGLRSNSMTVVDAESYSSRYVHSRRYGVRPAMWVNVKSPYMKKVK